MRLMALRSSEAQSVSIIILLLRATGLGWDLRAGKEKRVINRIDRSFFIRDIFLQYAAQAHLSPARITYVKIEKKETPTGVSDDNEILAE
jgi:hypothetical protein